MSSNDDAGLESLQRQWEAAEWIRGGGLDSRQLKKTALVEYRCRRNDLLAALVKVEGTLYFMWQQHRSIAVVNSDDLQDWDSGEVPEGVDADAVARAEEAVSKWRDVRRKPDTSLTYRPESLKESTDLTPEPVPGRWECIRFADWPETLSVHANCAHVPLQAGKGGVRGDARSVRRKRSKRVPVPR